MAVNLTSPEQQYYKYASIASRKSEVRLLTIEPAEFNDSPLHLSLTTYSLNDTVPRWDAVSYYWGNSETTQRVTIDGKLLRVNRNAFSALSHCRSRDQSRRVWIDQICINQNDEQERLEQIMLMGRIYREAQCVIAYISDAWPGIEILFAYLNVIGYEPKPWNLSWWKPWTAVASNSRWKLMLGSDRKFPAQTWKRLRPFHDHIPAIVEAYSEVLRLPWFRRTWIVQEAGLAQRLHIQCSFFTAPWSSFMVAHGLVMHGPKRELDLKMAHGSRSACAIDMIRCRRPGRRPLMKLVWNEFHRNLRRSSWTQYLSLAWGAISRLTTVEYPDLLGLMRHLRYQECTDERDKVFGLLGLANPAFAYPLADTTYSDGGPYKETISVLSFHFAVWHIMHTNTLDVLMSTCFGAPAHDDLPYWVPDWSQEAALCDTDWKFPLKKAPHQSGTQYPASAEFIPNEKALVVRGILLDVIDEVVEQSITVREFDNSSLPIWSDWKAFAMRPTSCSDPYICDAGRYEAYWRTLVYDVDSSGGRATEETGIVLTEWLKCGTTTKGQTVDITGIIVFRGRKIFRTKKGYLGNACQHVEVGDEVYILQGGRLPFVLRRDREVEGIPTATDQNNYLPVHRTLQGYKLIGGDAYVHGVCDGQVWILAEQEGIPVQEIALI